MIKNIKKAKHIEINIAQEKKHGQQVCGDHFLSHRDGHNTYAVLCDGIGSGMHAHMSAVMCAHRILELMKAHIDLKTLGHRVAAFMKRARTEENFPFAAFCAVSFSIDGRFRAVTYENPEPLLAEHTTVSKIHQTYSTDSGEVVGLCSGILEPGDTLFMMSDGITQAGLGAGGGFGWGSEGFLKYADDVLQQKKSVPALLKYAMEEVQKKCGGTHKDDATLIALTARPANVLNILSGPPKDKSDDKKYIDDFLKADGRKVICGSTTADIFSKMTGKSVSAYPVSNSFASPPKYEIEGVDLVTEGAATLSQAYNILDMDIKEYRSINAVTELCMLLKEADTVNFFIGCAKNLDNTGLTFKQLGILPRETIISLIIEKLRNKGVQTEIFLY